MLEFPFVAILLLVPLVYVVVGAAEVQRAAFAVTQATREAGRAFVTTTSGDPDARARVAAGLAMRDQGLEPPASGVRVSCSPDCTSPGSRVAVAVDEAVALPLLPRTILGRPVGTVVVHGRHVETIDDYREPLP
jgi:hypothetical protein